MSDLDLRQGHALEVLRDMPAESVQCVVTSPPYWGLRDYGLPPSTWGDGWSGCLGLEPTPQQFLTHLVEVFAEVKRVLRRDGTCWLNMGDCYSTRSVSRRSSHQTGLGFESDDLSKSWRELAAEGRTRMPSNSGLADKQRLLMPARCALALQADGWWVRSEIIWAKPNPMPSSVTDRPTDAHEMVYLLTRAPRYFYDADAVRERHAAKTLTHRGGGKMAGKESNQDALGKVASGNWGACDKPREINPAGRNRRTVWTIPTQAFPGAHFATFPERLVAPCILAGTSERGACSECGAPWRRVVERTGGPPQGDHRKKEGMRANPQGSPSGGTVYGSDLSKLYAEHGYPTRTTTGWEPTCAHADAPTRPCVVLDPFSGSGTTGLVARKLGRSYVGIELSEEYLELSRARLGDRDALRELREGESDPGAQLGLFG